jgi:hypothetical protein
MYEFKKNGKVFTSKFVGPGPSSYKKRIYRAAVSQRLRNTGLRSRSMAARLLRSWVQIPSGAWKFFCCVCCVLSVRGLWDELITRPDESYQLWRVVVCDPETSWYEVAIARAGLQSQKKMNISYSIRYSDSLRDGRFGDRIPVGARFSAPVQTGLGAHPPPIQWVPALSRG